jgi:hypothetical protein
MPTNTQIVAALSWTDAPPDLACIPGDINELGPLLAQFLQVNSTTSEIDTTSQDSVAQQALQQSAVALSTAQQALAATPNKRSSDTPLTIATGDSVLQISWSPAMPNTSYDVRGNYYGTDVAVAAYYAFRVVDGSRTVNGCTIRFDNTPASTKFAWVVEAL